MKTVITFIALSFGLISCSTGQQQDSQTEQTTVIFEKIDEQIFNKDITTKKDIQLIDVRTPAEYTQGHIAGALNYNISGADFDQQLATLDPNKPVYVYCAVGGRSGRAADYLKSKGFTAIYDLKGGMGEWSKAGLPIEK
jgi:rhodanese-related sulfurtransferase